MNKPAPTAPTTRKTTVPIASLVLRPVFVSPRLLGAVAAAGRRTRTTGTTTSSIGPVASATVGGSSVAGAGDSSGRAAVAGIDSGVGNGIRQCGQRTTWPSIVSGTRAAAWQRGQVTEIDMRISFVFSRD